MATIEAYAGPTPELMKAINAAFNSRDVDRMARHGDGWHPVGANPAIPLRPAELKASLDQLYRLTISFKAPVYDVTAPLTQAGERRPFSGTSEQILEDIEAYAKLGVSELIFDFRSEQLAQSLERMEHFAAVVKPTR